MAKAKSTAKEWNIPAKGVALILGAQAQIESARQGAIAVSQTVLAGMGIDTDAGKYEIRDGDTPGTLKVVEMKAPTGKPLKAKLRVVKATKPSGADPK